MIAHRRFQSKKGLFPKWKFEYDAEQNSYRCPAGQELTYRTTDRKGYRQYASDRQKCKVWPMLKECTQSQNTGKVLTRHVWEDSKDWVRKNRLSTSRKYLYRKRKETIERRFADAKELMGFATAVCADCIMSRNKP